MKLAILATLAALAHGHGYLSKPVSRNALAKQSLGHCTWGGSIPCDGDFMSLGGVSGPDPATGCNALGRSDPVTGSGGLSFANTGKITSYIKGSTINVEIEVTAYHGGKFEFRLQDVGSNSDPDGSKWATIAPLAVKSFSPACDGCTVEPCAPSSNNVGTCAQIPLTKHGNHNGHYDIELQLPADVECDHCVLQWHWTSSNSCPNGLACDASEQFWNCADIKIGSSGNPNTAPTAAPTNANPTPTAAPTNANPTAPTAAPTSPAVDGSGGCCHSLQSHIEDSWCQAACAGNIAAYPTICAPKSCDGANPTPTAAPANANPTAPTAAPTNANPTPTAAPTNANPTAPTAAPTSPAVDGSGGCCHSLQSHIEDSWCQAACAGNIAAYPTICAPKSCDGANPTPTAAPANANPTAPTAAPATPTSNPTLAPAAPTAAPATPTPATPTAAPSAALPTTSGCGSERRVAYFANWAIYGRDFHPWDMDLGRLTHVNYAFMDVSAQCEVASGDAYADFEKVSAEVGQTWGDDSVPKGSIGAFRIMRDGLTQTVKDKGWHFPQLKIMLSLGGWTWSTHFSACTADAAKRATLVRSAVDMLVRADGDGIDVDWEYPTGCSATSGGAAKCGVGSNSHDPADWDNYIALMRELRVEMQGRGFSRPMELTVAAGMAPALNTGAPLKEWVASMDAVNFMAYDYMGGWNKYTAHQTALRRVSGLPAGAPTDYNILDTVQIFLDAGVPRNKMVLGLASYGRSWEGTAGLHQAATGAGQGTWEKGIVSWHGLKANYISKGDWQEKWDADAEAPYLYSPSKGELVVYDNEVSIAIKAKWAQQNGFAGFMWWEASDDPTYDLHNAAVDAWAQQCSVSSSQSRKLSLLPLARRSLRGRARFQP